MAQITRQAPAGDESKQGGLVISSRSAETAGSGRAGARTQSLDRAVRLLLAVGAAPPDRSTVAALAKQCGLNRATAWRLLSTLESHGLVDRDPVTGRHTIGFTAVQLASCAGYDGLVAVAHPILARVSTQTGETADLAIVRPLGLTYIDEVTPASIVAATWLGRAVPLHATSTGKAMLAWLPEREAASMLAGPLTPYTDTTITNRDALAAELATTREQGYGVCRGELESTLFGVSAPVFDQRGRPLAVLSIWGPAERIPESRFPALGVVAKEAAGELAQQLGRGSQGKPAA